jgi:hypothetical protein
MPELLGAISAHTTEESAIAAMTEIIRIVGEVERVCVQSLRKIEK